MMCDSFEKNVFLFSRQFWDLEKKSLFFLRESYIAEMHQYGE